MKPPEERFEELRREALEKGRVDAPGVRAHGAPLPEPPSEVAAQQSETSYHELPLLKPPVWTWEIPLYFFVGGAAGASAMLAAVARITGAEEALVRDARFIAAGGAVLSAPLLISDLGRPERFLNMLRIFKPQSPMSVGAWTLAVFGGAATASALADELSRRTRLPVTIVADGSGLLAAATGLVMCTYTGVLLGVTAIPVWSEHVTVLPMHFGASALGSAVSLLELRGHDHPALNALGIGAATFETLTAGTIDRTSKISSEPLRDGSTGRWIRTAGLLSGVVPLALRLFGGKSRRARQLAAVATLAGSVITRFAWVQAGKKSAADPRPVMEGEAELRIEN